MAAVYFAPDWGMALRINGELSAEYGDDSIEVVGPWKWCEAHGTIFRVTSERFPQDWQDRLVRMVEEPGAVGENWRAKVELHDDSDFAFEIHKLGLTL